MKKVISTIVFAAFLFTVPTANAQTEGFDHKKGKYLEVDGAEIYYEETGNTSGPTLLFLHGGFGNIEDFNTVVQMFTSDYRVIGVDSRGHGKSTLGTDRLDYKRLQLDAEAVVNHLRLEDFDIIGYSDGGIVAYRMAAAKDVPVRKIVTIGATWSIADAGLMDILMADMTPEKYRTQFRRSFEFHQEHNPSPDFDKFAKCTSEMWFDKTGDGYPLESVADIDIPVLIIRGDNDPMLTLESAVELASRIRKSVLLNIPFAPHGAFRKYPEIFETITKEFLTRQE